MISLNDSIEHCWLIEGREFARGFFGELHYLNSGEVDKVSFEWERVSQMEDLKQTRVIGFLHTHPHTFARPSTTDYQTMNAWTCALGKSLICGIQGTDGLRAFLFEPGIDSFRSMECLMTGKYFCAARSETGIGPGSTDHY